VPLRPPLGQQIHLALVHSGTVAAASLASAAGESDLFERVRAVAGEEPIPSFLHSALCAMSLPVRRPPDEFAPIMRQDGQYTLVINPKPRVELADGQTSLRSLGIPYGSLPRLILIHIMTEAVKSRSRHILLGRTFTEWMRRLGFKTISYGPRGSATLIREQLDRLLACEWMIRWDSGDAKGAREFGIKEIKLTNEYVGIDGRSGGFQREIYMTEGFFEHLQLHAVPLNEVAIRQLRDSATALDLYTWLAYRLPRINPKRPATLSWEQLAVHFGNEGRNIRKFRQTVRDAWERQVSAVYPEARADLSTTIIRLYASPAPLQQKLVAGVQLRLATDENGTVGPPEPPGPGSDVPARFLAALEQLLGASDFRIWFKHSRVIPTEDGWVLHVGTRFIRDHVRGQFGPQLARAADLAGMGGVRVELESITA
jgi:hypothetical protein